MTRLIISAIIASVAAIMFFVAVALLTDNSSDRNRTVRIGSVEAEIDQGRRLVADAAPLSLADVERLPRSSARRAVLQLLFFAQWGGAPGVLDAYDPAVVGGLGAARIAGAYAWLRPQLAVSLSRIEGVLHDGNHAFVNVELFRHGFPPQAESFTLRRDGRIWLVGGDTLLARGLAEYTQFKKARDPDHPGAHAVKAGELAAQAYRNIYSSLRLAPVTQP